MRHVGELVVCVMAIAAIAAPVSALAQDQGRRLRVLLDCER